MKRRLIAILITALVLSCTDPEPANTMTLTGEIEGLKKGVVYLQHLPDSTLITIDSMAVDSEGRFAFTTTIESPELFYLYLKKADDNELNDRVSFFGEPGAITVRSSWNAFEQDMEITGSASNKILEEYRKVITRFNTRDLELLQASVSKPLEKDSIALDSLQQASDANLLRRYLYTLNFALNHKESHVAPYLAVTEAPDANLVYLDSIYSVLPEEVAKAKYGKALKALLDSRRTAGE